MGDIILGVRLMLFRLSSRISECLAGAADAHERASATTDPRHKADCLAVEAAWLRLAENYRFLVQADRFMADGHPAGPSDEKLTPTGVLVIKCPTTGREFSTGIQTDLKTLTRMSQELMHSHCPHCNVEHAWWTKEARLVGDLPTRDWVEHAANGASLAKSLDGLIRTAIELTDSKTRAAFYLADANATELRHITGMTEAYAQYVDGFKISPESLACGLAAATGRPIITPDVTEEPLWKEWLWLAKKFDYRACWSFPVENSAGKIVGTFAMYYPEPREAMQRDIDLAAVVTRAASIIISPH